MMACDLKSNLSNNSSSSDILQVLLLGEDLNMETKGRGEKGQSLFCIIKPSFW